MAARPNPIVWWLGLGSHWLPSLPAHAYPLVHQRDRELHAMGLLYWCVPVREHDWARDPDLDLACVHRLADFTLERVSLMAEAARSDARSHGIADMRALYERCALHLEAEITRLRGAA